MHYYQYLPVSGHTIATAPTESRNRIFGWALVCCLTLLNLLVLVYQWTEPAADKPQVSGFAGLQRNITRPWSLNQPANDSHWHQIWEEETSYDAGVVALDDSYAKSKRLPRAQRWPWDPERGVYLLNAYHSLHCIKNIRLSLEQHRASQPQSVPWAHVQHCLLVLREEVMCNADDVPRYSGFQPSHNSGSGQVRMCRDWSALEAWARAPERAGCWRHISGEGVHNFKELDRYRFCPEGSRYKQDSETLWTSA